ncbi:hypothetical protein ACQPYE_01080 [Actinosynnema sp. CA-299493]
MDEWLAERVTWLGAADNPALFLNRCGGRLTTRAAYDELRAIADDAGLEVSRDAEILSQSLETTRRYSLPTDADKQAVIERLAVDE